MTKTGKVARLNRLDSGPFVEINPIDAQRLAIGEGSEVRLVSRRGEAILPAVITDRVLPQNCFAPIHWGEETGELLAVNALTSDAVDPISLQPEFKFCAVRLERAPIKLADLPTGIKVGEQETAWLAGYLAAVTATGAKLPAAAPVWGPAREWFDEILAKLAPAEASSAAVTVLWASQTGRVEDHVPELVEALQARGISAVARSIGEATVADLGSTVLFVTSTTGDGDPPAEAVSFWRDLSADSAPDLSKLTYSVLAFGDSAYADFCGFGRRLDERLAELGANTLAPRTDCEPNFDQAAGKWIGTVGDKLAASGVATSASTAAAGSTVASKPKFGRNRPLLSELVRNERLTAEGSTKEVRRFGFALPPDTLSYEAGDALAVVPRMDPDYVEAWLNLTGLDPDSTVDAEHDPVRLVDLLSTSHDLAAITPAAARLIAERHRGSYLASLVAQDDRRQFDSWAWGRQLIDVVREYPVLASVDEWLSVLKPLTPRQYSISSSPVENPREVEVTVSVVRHRVHGPWRHGVCSSFLADRASDQVPIFVQRQRHFRPPTEADRAAIMVGPGTGIAPFRGFLRDRAAKGHDGKNWVFFGERNSATDFYYRAELEELRADGVLTNLDTAFSRDQEHRIYVQDKMAQNGAKLWRWLDEGAHFYVCGDRSRMAKDVESTLLKIAGEHGGLTPAGAKDWLAELAEAGRYAQDVY